MSVTSTLETVPEMAEQTPALLELGNLGLAQPQHEFSSFSADEKHACAWGETNISRKLTNPHRALQTTRQS